MGQTLSEEIMVKSKKSGHDLEYLLDEKRLSWLDKRQQKELLAVVDDRYVGIFPDQIDHKKIDDYQYFLETVNLNNMLGKPSMFKTTKDFYPALQNAQTNRDQHCDTYRELAKEMVEKLLKLEEQKTILGQLQELISDKKVNRSKLASLGDVLTSLWKLKCVRDWSENKEVDNAVDKDEMFQLFSENTRYFKLAKQIGVDIPDVVSHIMNDVVQKLRGNKTKWDKIYDCCDYLKCWDMVLFGASEYPTQVASLVRIRYLKNTLPRYQLNKKLEEIERRGFQLIDIEDLHDDRIKSDYLEMISDRFETQPDGAGKRRRLPMIALLSELNLTS